MMRQLRNMLISDKIIEDWEHRFPVFGWPGFGLLIDGAGHLAIGAAVAALPAVLGASTALCALLGWLAGVGREVLQYVRDDTPHLNLPDRVKDAIECALGGAIAGVLLC